MQAIKSYPQRGEEGNMQSKGTDKGIGPDFLAAQEKPLDRGPEDREVGSKI